MSPANIDLLPQQKLQGGCDPLFDYLILKPSVMSGT